MPFEGWVDRVSEAEIAGWVYLESNPDGPVAIEILADGVVVARMAADQFRADLQAVGKGNGAHGFFYTMPSGMTARTPLRARVEGQPWFIQHADRAFPRPYATMKHSCEYGLPENVRYTFSPTPPLNLAEEIPLADRLLQAYESAVGTDTGPARRAEDVWTQLEDTFFSDFLGIVRRKDAEALAVYMRDFFSKPISHGTFQGAAATASIKATAAPLFVTGHYMDFLASLAEAVGALRVENPESQGHYGENLFRSPDEVVERINTALGIDIVPPNVAGDKGGIPTARGIIAASDLRAVYAAYRIRELIGSIGNASVCEIGGGIGGVAYYCWQMGIRDYTIIDLPHIGLMQAYWLIRALPDARIVLCGEKDNGKPAIRLLPPPMFGQRRFDLIYNQDSFPEMHPEHSLAYLEKGKRIAPAVLSINQESESYQTATSRLPVVSDLVDRVGGYRRVYRFPHWLRVGYVEELYAVLSPLRRARWRGILRFFGWR